MYRGWKIVKKQKRSMEEGSREWSRSSREGDEDETALIWAALQRLPTYARIRKGVQYSEEKGDAREVDVMNIGLADSKKLVDRLLNTAHQDNELFLLNIKRRIDRYLNIANSKLHSFLRPYCSLISDSSLLH